MKKHIKLIAVLIVLAVLVGAATAIFLYIKKINTPSDRERALTDYMKVAENEALIYFENDTVSEKAMVKDGEFYLRYGFLHDELNSDFYLDEKEGVLIYVLPDRVITLSAGDTVKGIENVSETTPVFIKEKKEYYVLLSFADELSCFMARTYKEPNRLLITKNEAAYLYYDAQAEAVLRDSPHIGGDIVKRLAEGERVYYISGTGKGSGTFLEIMTEDGIFGYIQKKHLGDSYYMARENEFEAAEGVFVREEGKIRLGWMMVTIPDANLRLDNIVKNTPGMNVISPTWIRLIDKDGSYTSLSSSEYVEKAHAKGLKVWVLADNFDDTVDCAAFLASTSARTKFIYTIIKEVKEIGADGINIDFESIQAGSGEDYVQFIKELSVAAHKDGITVSVDNYVPLSFNTYYNIGKQSEFADYIIIMAYDEHYSGSKEAGSVASLSYTKKAINNSTPKVPKESLVIGIPFYSRIWTTDKSGTLTSKVLLVSEVEKFLKDNDLKPKWDETTGQNYIEYEKNGANNKIWIEDKESLEKKLRAIGDAGLAGTAAWRLEFETKEIWDLISYMIQ